MNTLFILCFVLELVKTIRPKELVMTKDGIRLKW